MPEQNREDQDGRPCCANIIRFFLIIINGFFIVSLPVLPVGNPHSAMTITIVAILYSTVRTPAD